MNRLALTDKIVAAERAHTRGMNGTRRNIATIPWVVRFRFSIQRERHFATQDNMGRFRAVLVIGIESVRAILPDIRVAKTFFVQARS